MREEAEAKAKAEAEAAQKAAEEEAKAQAEAEQNADITLVDALPGTTAGYGFGNATATPEATATPVPEATLPPDQPLSGPNDVISRQRSYRKQKARKDATATRGPFSVS